VSNLIFPFEMEIGSNATVIDPKEYADKGMIIRRDSESRWSRVDDPDPSWVWTDLGASMLVKPI
jgi:hypothetical protein